MTSNIPASQRNSIYRNASINHRLEPPQTVSTGAARTRRKVKRRNSTSSIGNLKFVFMHSTKITFTNNIKILREILEIISQPDIFGVTGSRQSIDELHPSTS